jgi:hypothetical protein
MSKGSEAVSTFWWVNQSETYEEAKPLGVLWAPLENKRGRSQWHWDSMDRAKVGDVVIHYANRYVRAISRVLVESRKAEITIRGSGKWGELGRELRVDLTEFEFPIKLDEIEIKLRLDHPAKTAPFTVNGGVKQGYFYPLPANVALSILKAANLFIPADSEIQDEVEDSEEQDLEPLFYATTDGTIKSTVRKEQSALRDRIFKGKPAINCGICGKEYPKRMVHAAHIKKRSMCSHSERLDPYVVMPACLFGCDALFELGIIFVDSDGVIQVNTREVRTPDLEAQLNELIGSKAPGFSEKSARYFAWHRESYLQR